MRQRGRKSRFANELNVIAGGFVDKRPKPPDRLSNECKILWRDIVRDEPPELFATAATRDMLLDYCLTRELIERVRKQIADTDDADAKTRKLVWDLTKSLSILIRDSVLLATKLRMTNKSRYSKIEAGTASRNTLKEDKPWQL